jgi:hypothetical protein
VTVPVDPIAIALAVARALGALGIIHTIGGSTASSIAGEPRSTLDIDIVAALGESDVPALVAALSPEFYVAPTKARCSRYDDARIQGAAPRIPWSVVWPNADADGRTQP